MTSRFAPMYERQSLSRGKFGNLLHSDPNISTTKSVDSDDDNQFRKSSASAQTSPVFYESGEENSIYDMSPYNASSSPFASSPWITTSAQPENPSQQNGLVASLVREEGHIYSLAAVGDLLYTGSDSKNIRVWKNEREFSGFKSGSGLVKAIVISGEKIFTGHQDGKIRVWKISSKDPSVHKRAGTLPKLRHVVKSSIKPSNYVEIRRHRNALWLKHFDAISCLSLNEDQGLLYSGSWDKTLKVWRISDSKCLESINAHDDAVNSVVSGFDGLLFTGSADGTVKVWRRELQAKGTKHFLLQTLLQQESAVTALAVNSSGSVVYCGSSDGLVNFWEREKHLSHGGVLRGHKQAVLCLATKGNLLFSGSADKSICVWRREDEGDHTCLTVLNSHTGPVKCLAVVEDEESTVRDRIYILYSGSLDKSVKIWKISENTSDTEQMTTLHPLEEMDEGFSAYSFQSENSFSSAWSDARR